MCQIYVQNFETSILYTSSILNCTFTKPNLHLTLLIFTSWPSWQLLNGTATRRTRVRFHVDTIWPFNTTTHLPSTQLLLRSLCPGIIRHAMNYNVTKKRVRVTIVAVEKQWVLYHVPPTFWWKRVTPAIVGRFEGGMSKNKSKWYICLFVFLGLQPIVVVFLQPSSGL